MKHVVIVAPNKSSIPFATQNRILNTLSKDSLIYTTVDLAKQFDKAQARPRSWLLESLNPGAIDLLVVVGYHGATDMISKARKANIDIDIYRDA